jgi:hypothetical protein
VVEKLLDFIHQIHHFQDKLESRGFKYGRGNYKLYIQLKQENDTFDFKTDPTAPPPSTSKDTLDSTVHSLNILYYAAIREGIIALSDRI